MVLTNFAPDPVFDLPAWRGQRQATFRFDLMNAVTGQSMGTIHPLRTGSITHDVSRMTKRQLSIGLGVADVAAINPIQERIRVFMVLPDGQEYPLGVFMFTATTEAVFTSGNLGDYTLSDEMFLVDQQISEAIGRPEGDPNISTVPSLLRRTLEGLPIRYVADASSFTTDQSWGIGTTRGQILEQLALAGDWFSPWFNNTGLMKFIRAFEPADQIPDFDWDAGFQVLRSGITKTTNILTIPDRFIITGNAPTASTDFNGDPVSTGSVAIVGSYDVPSSFPYSRLNRGFSIVSTQSMAVYSTGQANAVARNIGIREAVYETLNISTAPDPRHDSYNVVHWQGGNWLELSWSMALIEGGEMQHVLRRAYRDGNP